MNYIDILHDEISRTEQIRRKGCILSESEFCLNLIDRLNKCITDFDNDVLYFDENDYLDIIRCFNKVVSRYKYDIKFLERLFEYGSANEGLDVNKIWDSLKICEFISGLDFLFYYIDKEEVLNKLYCSDNYKDVYNILDRYSWYECNCEDKLVNSDDTKELRNKLFISYLGEMKNKKKDSMFLEEVLLDGYYLYDKEVICYLLDQDIDLSYGRKDDGEYLSLMDTLSIYWSCNRDIKDPIIMNKIINKLNGRKIFVNDFGQSTNLCRMHIIAGDLRSAIREFDTGMYYSYSYRNLVKLLGAKKCFFTDESNGEDEVSNIIRELYFSDIDVFEKEVFLLRILLDERTVLIERDIISVIRKILSEENYNKYIEYLSKKISNNEAALFEIVKINKKYRNCGDFISYGFSYVELDSILDKANSVKRLKR